ncbi:hypothetical protein RHGRI_031523 [Rhododendron griersonianum]|uniref:Uncharacterized protein n=1 Tax=Rhododendron griersonianum TaxID=479676 RepID=A0AAV6I859_9ERIC|nr:hypothetical protein RHGRI_031523 [Rhododendron griersonianum]
MSSFRAKQIVKSQTTFSDEIKNTIKSEKLPINLDILIDRTQTRSPTVKMGLRPAFNGDFPESLYPFYPLAEEALPFGYINADWTAYPRDIPNRLWHRPDKQYVQWVNRVAAVKGGLWKEIGIYEALMLSRSLIDMDKALFMAAAQF